MRGIRSVAGSLIAVGLMLSGTAWAQSAQPPSRGAPVPAGSTRPTPDNPTGAPIGQQNYNAKKAEIQRHKAMKSNESSNGPPKTIP